MTRRLRSLRRDTRGVTIIEFGFVAPVLCLFLVGAFDIAHTLYMRAALQGIVQKASRDSALESGLSAPQQAAIDAAVTRQAQALHANATVNITRRFYRTFSEAALRAPEAWTDTNSNGRCDAGEPYEDKNLNSTWDVDGGDEGTGGAEDAVIYTATVTYPHLLPLWQYIGGSNTARVTATTVWRNQPYADQSAYSTPVVRNCP